MFIVLRSCPKTYETMKRIVLFLFFISKVLSQNCILDVSDPQTPFIVNDDFTLPTYDEVTSITFQTDELFYVICPTGTHSRYLAETGDRIACKNGTNILNIRTVDIIDFTEIKCKPSSTATVKKSGQQCATNGTLFEIGFDVYNKFISVVTVCFDEVDLTPIYCKYDNAYSAKFKQINAGSDYYESHVCNGTACDWVDSGNVYTDINMDGIYDNQAEILQNLGVGDVGVALLRFPLAISVLGKINSENDRQRIQSLPYFDYINVVPLWDLENVLDYLITVLVISLKSNPDLTFCIGTLGVIDVDQVEVFLINGNQIPVPKWIWVVWNMEILFYYNHPNYAEEAEIEMMKICSDPSYTTYGNIYSCFFEAVTQPEMRKLIDNGFN